MYLVFCTLYLPCIYLVFTCAGESYRSRLRSLLLHLRCVFPVLITPLFFDLTNSKNRFTSSVLGERVPESEAWIVRE